MSKGGGDRRKRLWTDEAVLLVSNIEKQSPTYTQAHSGEENYRVGINDQPTDL